MEPTGEIKDQAVRIQSQFEQALREQLVLPSRGQIETSRKIANIIAKPSGDKKTIYVQGLSGTGKTSLLQALNGPLAQERAVVIGDEDNPQEFLEGHPEVDFVVVPAQASLYPIPGRITRKSHVVKHRGFTFNELHDLFSSEAKRTDEDDRYAKPQLYHALALSLGSLELGRQMINAKIPKDNQGMDIFHPYIQIVGKYLAQHFYTRPFEGATEMRRKADEWRGQFPSQLIDPLFTFVRRGEFNPRYLRSVLASICNQMDYGSIFDNGIINEVLSTPDAGGIPFAFKAQNSEEIYRKLAEGYSSGGISVLAPNLDEDTIRLIAKQCGFVTEDFTQEQRLGERIKKGMNVPNKDIYSYRVFKGSGFIFTDQNLRFAFDEARDRRVSGVPKEISGAMLYPASWDTNDVCRLDDHLKAAAISSGVFGENQKGKAVVGFYQANHGQLSSPGLRLGVVAETLLQQLDLSYVASYPNFKPGSPHRQRRFIYNPQKQMMEEISEDQ